MPLWARCHAAARYRVLNQLGQEVNCGTLINGAATVGLARLPIGLYQIILETSEGRAMRSLMHRQLFRNQFQQNARVPRIVNSGHPCVYPIQSTAY